ncbi:MAG TPA: sigma-70 family RNA polymerase sigma factor [Gemmatimonadaceae bacterium]|nr:sigma-70 family RNA polymerase sigma factor [Gemmatimonadaceae bacterium]
MISTRSSDLFPSREAFEEEALRWTADVHRFALSLTRDESDADDVVQDTYLRAFRSWRTFAPDSDCRRWLFTICRNVFLRSREKSARWVSYDTPEMDGLLSAGAVTKFRDGRQAGDLAAVDVWPAIHGAVSRIPEPFRSTVIAVDVDDDSYEGAAERLGVPIGTVRSRLFRGRRLLQQQLRSYALDFGVVAESNILRGRASIA